MKASKFSDAQKAFILKHGSDLVAETCDEWNVLIRRACRVVEFDTSTYHTSPAAAIRPASKLGSGTSAPHGSATDTGACT